MNVQQILRQVAVGDFVSVEINGRPGSYEGIVTGRGPYSMTFRSSEDGKAYGIRFESVDWVTVRKTH